MIGETMLDPDYVPRRKLMDLASDAGFVVERREGAGMWITGGPSLGEA